MGQGGKKPDFHPTESGASWLRARCLVLHLLLAGVGAELGGMESDLTMTRSRELKTEIRLSDSLTQTKILLIPWCIKHQGEKGEAAGVGSTCMLPTSAANGMRPITLG